MGFVTVTDVRTSPDLRHARVYVSVLGERGRQSGRAEREDTLAGLRSAHGYLQGRVAARAAAEAHAHARVRLRRDDRPRDARGGAARRDRRVVSAVEARRHARTRAGARAHPRGRALRAGHPREPRRRRARLARCDARPAHRARQGLRRCSSRRATCRCPTSTACSPLRRQLIQRAARRTSPSARSCSSTAATSTATPPACCATAAHLLNIDHHHDNTRFGTLNHVVPDASCTAEIVWDLMHGLGVRADAGDRRGAVHRPDHRHRALHVREHRRRARTRWPPS